MRAVWTNRPWGTVVITLAAVVVFAASDGGVLTGDRLAFGEGQLWRLWTAHLVHFSASHLSWSGLVWLTAGAWMEREDRGAWTWAVLAGAPIVTMTALAGDAAMARYGGLSGLSCVPLAWAGCRLWCDDDRARRATGAAMLSALAWKIGAELGAGGTLFARFAEEVGEVRSAPWAHAAGALTGIALFLRGRVRTSPTAEVPGRTGETTRPPVQI